MAIELRRGTARGISTRAEYNRGQGWRSVAYFNLEGQAVRLVCEALAPYSRAPLPPAFEEGDDLIVVGKIDKRTGLFNSLCARLVRQGVTFDENNTATIIVGGLGIFALGTYPVAKIVRIASSVPIDSIGRVLARGTGLLPFFLMMLAVSLTGLFMLVVGMGQIKTRRMLDVAVRGG